MYTHSRPTFAPGTIPARERRSNVSSLMRRSVAASDRPHVGESVISYSVTGVR